MATSAMGLPYCSTCPASPVNGPISASCCATSSVIHATTGSLDTISRFIANLQGRPLTNSCGKQPAPLAVNAKSKIGSFALTQTTVAVIFVAIIVVVLWMGRK